jgi:hypothetical protein
MGTSRKIGKDNDGRKKGLGIFSHRMGGHGGRFMGKGKALDMPTI